MKKLNQDGSINPFIIPFVLAALVAIGLGVMTIKYYGDYVDQRDRNQPKIEAAVDKAKGDQKKQLDAEFEEREKQPYKTFTAPSSYGSVRLTFPKTWSAYVETGKGNVQYGFYSHPNFVPSEGVAYALRMSVVDRQFAQEVDNYDRQIEKNELKTKSIRVSGVTGARLDGFLEKDLEGSMVIFPLRDKTLRVWTESTERRKDFDNIIVKNLSFVP